MKVGQLAKRAGTTAETVRYYERKGLLPPPVRTDSNYRDYGPGDVERLSFIRHARELGFDLADIRSLISLGEAPDRDCGEIDGIAREHLLSVEAKLRRLQLLRQELRDLISQCGGGQVAHCAILKALGDHPA